MLGTDYGEAAGRDWTGECIFNSMCQDDDSEAFLSWCRGSTVKGAVSQVWIASTAMVNQHPLRQMGQDLGESRYVQHRRGTKTA